MSDLKSFSASDSEKKTGETQSLSSSRPWRYLNLPLVDYEKTLELQRKLVQARIVGALDTNAILLAEHPPVFTIGRNGSAADLLVSEDFLRQSGVPLVRTERGGRLTWHGPGQLVVYPIVHLKEPRMRLKDFVWKLEEIMIHIAADCGVAAGRDPRNRGVWAGNNKLGSLGIAIRRGVSFHGFALNINPSLEYFNWIHPCGLKGVQVTSIANESRNKIRMPEVRTAALRHIEQVFEVSLEPMG